MPVKKGENLRIYKITIYTKRSIFKYQTAAFRLPAFAINFFINSRSCLKNSSMQVR
jgi:hypothetical protein